MYVCVCVYYVCIAHLICLNRVIWYANTISSIWDSVQQNHSSGQFFKFSNFFIFRELQRTSIKWSLRILNWTIHHKVIRPEFIISHAFQCKRYFSFACPGKFDKVSQG